MEAERRGDVETGRGRAVERAERGGERERRRERERGGEGEKEKGRERRR